MNALADALPGVRVGTVDKFQGQEAAVALVSLTASSAEETARGLDFLLSRDRFNVAVSLVFAAPRLTETPCATVEQIRLVNSLCALDCVLRQGRARRGRGRRVVGTQPVRVAVDTSSIRRQAQVMPPCSPA